MNGWVNVCMAEWKKQNNELMGAGCIDGLINWLIN
jgi:hypothetical protein